MRIGQHPLKTTLIKLNHEAFHRILIPVYIPELKGYYENLFEVFKWSMESLLATVSSKFTKITIINNGSASFVVEYINDLFKENKIDKVILLKENRGKLESVTNEARASVEEFISIVDADILFLQGWEKAVFNIFSTFLKASVVSPMPAPQHAFYYNKSCQFDLLINSKMRWGNISPLGVELIEKGFDNYGKLEDYKKGQYYTIKEDVKVLLGCGHFCATYKRDIFFHDIKRKVEYVFKGGYEAGYIDCIADFKGGWRLATHIPYAYHMGNSLPDENILKIAEEYKKKYKAIEEYDKFKLNLDMPNTPLWVYKFKKKAIYFLQKATAISHKLNATLKKKKTS
jgi:Glycosyl transferase family 2